MVIIYVNSQNVIANVNYIMIGRKPETSKNIHILGIYCSCRSVSAIEKHSILKCQWVNFGFEEKPEIIKYV